MQVIDISHRLDEKTPLYPGDHALTLSEYKTMADDNYALYVLTSSLHTGTHLDMPMHLAEDNRAAADFTADRFIGRGVLLDVRGQNPIVMDARYEDVIKQDDIVLLYTGFDEKYFQEAYFTRHPVVSGELCEFLISRKIKLLGVDMPAPDYAPFVIHKALLAKDIFLLENLTNLQSLLAVEAFEVIALPLKIAAEASFTRAVCRVLDTKTMNFLGAK